MRYVIVGAGAIGAYVGAALVRGGADVFKALALGAAATLVGRPYAYGLAANGEEGVVDVMRILTEELKRAMILMGCPSVSALDRSWVVRAEG